MKTKTFFLAVWLMIAVNLLAQNPGQEFTDRMNYIFQQVDKSLITTGLLIDYGLQMVEPEVFNGIPADSNYVSMDTWKMLYSGLYTSKINNNVSLTIPTTVFTQISNATHATAVPLAMMHYQYNKLNENAVNLGLLQVVNDQIIEVAGAASPYLTRQLFAVAPKDLFFDGPTARFVFKSNLWYSNVNKTIQKREINFNNESGYIQAAWDTQVSYTFSSGGVKTIYFRLTYTDGSYYTSQTNISVTDMPASLRSSQADIDSVIIAPTSQHSGGKIQFKLSSYNNTGQIRKPLIVVEGFDPSYITGKESGIDLNDFLKSGKSFGTIDLEYSEGNLKDKIDLAQFDIVYLDYKNGVDDIFRNAQLFKEVIQWVNNNKQGNEQNIVMGISMGGLVARIALRQMEVAGQNHQTLKYISVDTPHKGANVPAGFQAMLRHVQNTNLRFGIIPTFDYTYIHDLKNAVDLLNSMATKQMLIYTINSSYNFDNSVHTAFQSQYDQLGFPQQCQNVTISNGSNNGTLTFAAGSYLIDYNKQMNVSGLEWISHLFLGTNYILVGLLWNPLPGKSDLIMDFDVKALKDKSASEIYHGEIYIKKKTLWLISSTIPILSKTVNSTSAMLPLDGAPGGKYSISQIAGQLPFGDDAIKQSDFCFIPTVSSLALNDWETRLTQNLTNINTPFSQRFSQIANELHTRFNSSASFLYDELTIPDLSISGPSIVCSNATFTLNSHPSINTVSWNVSGPFTLSSQSNTSAIVTQTGTIGSSGILTATINGCIVSTKNLNACNSSPCNVSIFGPSSINYLSSGLYTATSCSGNVQWWLRESANPNGAVLVEEGSSVELMSVGSASPSILGSTIQSENPEP